MTKVELLIKIFSFGFKKNNETSFYNTDSYFYDLKFEGSFIREESSFYSKLLF